MNMKNDKNDYFHLQEGNLAEFDKELSEIEIVGIDSEEDIIMKFVVSTVSESYRTKNQDAYGYWEHSSTVIALADGVGGIGSGDIASNYFINQISLYTSELRTKEEWMTLLSRIDHQIPIGETTGIVVQLQPGKIVGASVGDSSAKIFDFDKVIDLTVKQERKPLIGSRESIPVGFEYPYETGFLILGSDGFYNHIKDIEIMKNILWLPLMDAAHELLNKVRLKNGELWDDTTVIVGKWVRQY